MSHNNIFLCKEEPFFVSPDGEGCTMGVLCGWMRVTYCNLRCCWLKENGEVNYCDSPFTSHYPTKQEVTVEEAFKWFKSKNINLASISGGCPFIQDNVIRLVDMLEDSGLKVKIETNGTIFKPSKASYLTISPKLKSSSSGLEALLQKEEMILNHLEEVPLQVILNQEKKIESARNKLNLHNNNRYNLETLKKIVHHYGDKCTFKFVIKSRDDLEEILKDYVNPLWLKSNQVWLMPEGISTLELNNKAQDIIETCKEYGFNYSDRLHIRIYGNKIGV